MKYKQRPGIVLTQICGMNVLIPSRLAYPECQRVQKLPLLWAATWDLISHDKDEEDIFKLHRLLTNKTDEEIRQRLDEFFTVMCQKGYLFFDSDTNDRN